MGKKIDFDKIKITDDMLFNTVLYDKYLLCEFVKMCTDIKVSSISLINKEVVKDSISKTRGIRFDVYVENDEVVYDIEIQALDTYDLPYRTRYYQSMIDSNLLNKGDKSFSKLKKSYIIFICLFNPFKSCGINQCIYKFENLCILEDNTTYSLDDMSYKVFINTKCDEKYIHNYHVKSFIELLNNGYVCNTKSVFTDKIISRMNHLKQNEDWRRQYMDLMSREEHSLYEGRILEAISTTKRLINMGFDNSVINKVVESLNLEQIEKIRQDMICNE